MNTFLEISFSFPTLIWSGLLLFSLLYWLIAMIGMVDFDVIDVDMDISDVATGGVTGLMATLGLTGVPLPVVLTAVGLGGWVSCYFGQLLILSLLPSGLLYFAGSALLLIASLFVGAKSAAVLIKPLRGLFQSTKANQNDVLGTTGTVVYTVSETSGVIDCTVNGAFLRLQARSTTPIAPGEKAVLIKYHNDLEAYQAIPEADFITGAIR